MKTNEVYKCNGRTFTSIEAVRVYACTLGMVITNIETIIYKGSTIHLVDIASR